MREAGVRQENDKILNKSQNVKSWTGLKCEETGFDDSLSGTLGRYSEFHDKIHRKLII